MDKQKQKVYISIIIVLIILIVLVSTTLNLQKNNNKIDVASLTNEVDIAEYNNQVEKQVMYDNLKSMPERNRMEYYITNFFSYIENNKYEKAYALLNEDFKNNYFATLQDFENYCSEHFSIMTVVDFTNIERQDKTYFMWLNVQDMLNGKKSDKGVQYTFVILEKDLNDIEMSFSVK